MDLDVLYDQKWCRLLGRSWLFGYLPFVNFVLVAGSMALRQVHNNSDFDVVVGARVGRIFTVRFFCWLVFGVLGWRRFKRALDSNCQDRFCFNHFVTRQSYCLRPPYNDYWCDLYSNLVPVYGDRNEIERFFASNFFWVDKKPRLDLRSSGISNKKVIPKVMAEKFLSGGVGDYIEIILRLLQKFKIKISMMKGIDFYQSRWIICDEELEFHQNTLRIEKRLRRLL